MQLITYLDLRSRADEETGNLGVETVSQIGLRKVSYLPKYSL